MPRVPAAALTSRISEAAEALLDLTMIASRRIWPASSRNSSTRLPAISAVWLDKPVMFPPGRASDATRPEASGSPAGANTIGICDVALFAATVGGVHDVTLPLYY